MHECPHAYGPITLVDPILCQNREFGKGHPVSERIAGYLYAAESQTKRNERANAMPTAAHRALALDGTDVNATCFLADLHLKLGEFDAAIEKLEQGIAANPAFTKGGTWTGRISWRAGGGRKRRGGV